MTGKSMKFACWAAIGGSLLLADYAAGHSWPLWSITLAGVIFISAVVTYIIAAQSQ